MTRLNFNPGTEDWQAYQVLRDLGLSDLGLDTGYHRVNYSARTDGLTWGRGNGYVNVVENWTHFSRHACSVRETATSIFGDLPPWCLPIGASALRLQPALQQVDAEIQRLRTQYQNTPHSEFHLARGLYRFVVSDLAISPVNDIHEDPAGTVLERRLANCSEFFSTLKTVFGRAGLEVFPVFVFESATGDTTPHIATGFNYGGRTYILDPFYDGFDTPHRRWVSLSLREFWAWQHNNRGLLEANAGNLSRARGLFSWAERLDPYNPHFPNNLGLKLEASGFPEEAEVSYRRAMRVDSNFIEPYVNLGALLIKEGQYRQAALILRRGLEINSSDGRILYNLALAYYELQNFGRSLDFAERAVRLNPTNSDYSSLRADARLMASR